MLVPLSSIFCLRDPSHDLPERVAKQDQGMRREKCAALWCCCTAASSLSVTPAFGEVLLKFNFGKLVRTKHKRQITCSLEIEVSSDKTIKFTKNTCKSNSSCVRR